MKPVKRILHEVMTYEQQNHCVKWVREEDSEQRRRAVTPPPRRRKRAQIEAKERASTHTHIHDIVHTTRSGERSNPVMAAARTEKTTSIQNSCLELD